MSGAERVEPEVSPAPAKTQKQWHTKMHTHSHTLCACKLFYSPTKKKKTLEFE